MMCVTDNKVVFQKYGKTKNGWLLQVRIKYFSGLKQKE
jgi:hypothetical protein